MSEEDKPKNQIRNPKAKKTQLEIVDELTIKFKEMERQLKATETRYQGFLLFGRPRQPNVFASQIHRFGCDAAGYGRTPSV